MTVETASIDIFFWGGGVSSNDSDGYENVF